MPGEALFSTSKNPYPMCWYRIGHDQVKLVRSKLPKPRYFGLCLYNGWMESLDYRRHVINLNHVQLQTGGDGSFELCLGHRDQRHPRGLNRAGHLLARALLPELETKRRSG